MQETQTIFLDNRPEYPLKRTWENKDYDSYSNDNISNIANNQPDIQPRNIRTTKAKFSDISDKKKDFQELSEVVEKFIKKVFKWMQQYINIGKMLDDF